jgi:hypothetical protein
MNTIRACSKILLPNSFTFSKRQDAWKTLSLLFTIEARPSKLRVAGSSPAAYTKPLKDVTSGGFLLVYV